MSEQYGGVSESGTGPHVGQCCSDQRRGAGGPSLQSRLRV